jgi:cytochrome bd-type quinol oxidase subunit 2
MSWSILIPTSMLSLGAIMLGLAGVLVFLDVPGKGVPWDKVAAWFAIVGGFGVGGAAAGSIGRALSTGSHSVLSNGQHATAQGLGVGAVALIVIVLLLWAYARARGKGISTKSKFKSLMIVAVLALVGTVLSGFPGLYSTADEVINWAGTTLRAAIPS